MVHYASSIQSGLHRVSALDDGTTINLSWYRAYPDVLTNKIAYHIYYACDERYVFSEGVKFIITDGYCQTANIINLTPSEVYWFSLLPVEYNPLIINYLNELPIANDNVRFYPESMLDGYITPTDGYIPLMDVECFPPAGIVKIDRELIQYSSIIHSPKCSDGYLVVLPSSSAANIELTYTANVNNIGDGYIDGYVPLSAMPNQTFRVACVFVEINSDGYSIPNTAKFECIGSISGNPVDGYGDFVVWKADGYTYANELLSFAIYDGYVPFVLGDSFTITATNINTNVNGGRGFNNTKATYHHNSEVSVIAIEEDNTWKYTYACQARFEYPHYQITAEGPHQVKKDFLSTDLEVSDAANISFPEYDYAGYHRTDPVQILDGTCVGSYIGGQMGCIDGYGNYNIYRGLSLQQRNLQNQEILLSVTGRDAVLITREQTGITCNCVLQSSQYPDDRCPFCLGTRFVLGYQQYFNPRRSDGRIKVRIGPTSEKLRMTEAGLESEVPYDMWTLTVPTIKMRDVIILFDQANNEEFRYEVADVIRNNTILGLEGMQKLKSFRIRKTDPAYQIRVMRDTSDFPSLLNTSLGFGDGIPPHAHTVKTSEKVLSISQINQMTDVVHGHNHEICDGKITPTLHHTHHILMPDKERK